MTSSQWKRRRDLKTQDREKSLSPLDKDRLKERCLERVRTERSRLMARMRGRSDRSTSSRAISGDFSAATISSAVRKSATLPEGELLSPSPLSSASEILRQGLNEMAGESRRQSRDQHDRHDHQKAAQLQQQQHRHRQRQCHTGSVPEPGAQGSTITYGTHSWVDAINRGKRDDTALTEIEEETAYLEASGGGRNHRDGRSEQTPPDSIDDHKRSSTIASGRTLWSRNLGGSLSDKFTRNECDTNEGAVQEHDNHGSPTDMEGDHGWYSGGQVVDEEHTDEENLLSREEYLEMMQYIEEACREEDLRAETEVLDEYERTRRLEEEAVESEISSGLDVDGNDQDRSVLCPVCKRDYLLQAGPPSDSIVCACGFRLDTAGDRLGLKHLRQQLAETYSQHSGACGAEPSFSLEGVPGLDILWSSCDGCGFARVVL